MVWLSREQCEPQLAPGFSSGTLAMRWRPRRQKGRNWLPARGPFQGFQVCSYSDGNISSQSHQEFAPLPAWNLEGLVALTVR